MELKVNPKDLGAALRVSSVGDLIELKTGENTVEALTYFELQWFRAGVSADIIKPGRVTVKRDRLTALLNSLTQDTTLKIKGTKLVASNPVDGTYQLMTFRGEIPIPVITPQHESFDLTPSFLESFNRASLTGELMGGGYSVNRAFMYSSDRIRILKTGIDDFTEGSPFIIPADLAKSFSGVLPRSESAKLLVSHQHVVLRCQCPGVTYEIGGSTVVSRFPDVNSIIAKTTELTNSIDLKTDQLKEIVGRLSKVYEPKFVDLILGPESCTVSCVTEDGNASVELEASHPLNSTARVQTLHTLDTLNRISGPTVNLRWSDDLLLWSDPAASFSLITTPGRVT